MRAVAVSALALMATCAAKAEDVVPPASGSGAVEINIHEDSTLTVSADVEYESLAVTGSGKLTLSGAGRITAQSVSVADGITFVNCGQLNSTPVAVGTNAVFEIASPMTWTNTISGLGGVRVSADEVVFNKQNTFTGGLTVAPGGRARSNVGASLGGGGGGGYGGTATWDSSINANRFYGNVTVESGGAADMIRNHYLSCYSLFLSGTGINGSGAAFRSGGINDAENQPHAVAITLVDDATVSANNAWGLVAPSYRATTLSLSNHTLTITGTNNFLLCNTTINGTGTIEIADGATLKTIAKDTTAGSSASCLIKSGGKLFVNRTTKFNSVVCEAGGTIKFVNNKALQAASGLVLPSEGYAALDISDLSDLSVGGTKTLIECSSVTTDTDVSHLRVTGKANYLPKAVSGGIAVERVQEALVWSDGSWNVASEDIQRYSEAEIVLSEGQNVVELPVDLSFYKVTVSAAAVASVRFGSHTATVGELVLGENVTFVNNGLLNSAPVSIATNAVFEIASPMTWTNAISGAGGVRVSADEVVFAAQSTFEGGLTVAAGGRARTTVPATTGGGYGGTATWDSSINANRFYGNVTAESGGAVDMVDNHYLSCYSLILAGTGINGSGAAYRSGGIVDPENQPHAMVVTLTDDATVCADNAWGLLAPSFRSTTLNLSDHTLTITGTNNFLLVTTTITGTGTIEIADGATLKTTADRTTSSSASCRIKSGGKFFVNRNTTVSNVVCEAGSTMAFGYDRTLQAVGELVLPSEGYVTLDISAMPDLSVGSTKTLIECDSVTTDTDVSRLRVTGKENYLPKAVAGGIAVMRRPDALVWSNGSWNVSFPEAMQLYNEASIVLSAGTNEVAFAGEMAFDRVTVSAAESATLLFTGSAATIGELALGANVTYVHTGTVTNDTVTVGAGAGIASECDALVATNVLSLALGSTVYRGANPVKTGTIAITGAVPVLSSPRLLRTGNESTIAIRNTTGENPSGLWPVIDGEWAEPRPDINTFIFEPELPPGEGGWVVADNGLYSARASLTSSTGSVTAYESAQDAVDAAEGKGGKVSVHASGSSISLGSGWFSSGASIVVPAGVIGVTVSVAGVVIGGKDSDDDSGSRKYDEEEPERVEVVETGVKYSSLSLAKSTMGNTSCTFRLLAESADSIHLASASDVSGQTLLLNNWPYAGTVTGAAASLSRASSVTAYYAILADAKADWTEGDTINLLSDNDRYTVGSGKTLVLDGEKTYAVAKPFDLTGTLTVGGCTFTASAGININAGTLRAAKANCTLIGGGIEVTLREGGVRVDTDGYAAEIAATLTVAGGLQTKPVILKAGLADLRLSGGVTGGSVITIQSGCGKVYAPASSNCEPGDYTQISEQTAEWATFENGIAVARLVKADGSSTAYSSVNAAGAAAQINPTYQYIEILANNQTLRCLPTIGILRIKYNLDDVVLTFSVQSLAPDWTFDEVYGVEYSVFTPVHKATDYVWDGGQDGDWESMGNWKCNLALDYDLPVATRTPDGNDTVIFRDDGMPEAGWSVCIGSSGGACKEIKVEENAMLTLSYDSLGCDITKTGAGTITVTNAWTSGMPTITVEEDGGTVTIPKSAAYTTGENTAVVSETEDTVTLGFGVPTADPYATWAAENGITGAWNEKDASGVYNVFRYLFDEPSGDIRIIDISFDAEGNVVITTAQLKNPEGFTISVVETSDVDGKTVTGERTITSSSNTATFEKSAFPCFYRVKVNRSK